MATTKSKNAKAPAGKTPPQAVRDDTAIVAASARVLSSWTPAQLRSAFTSAESGYLSTAVQICDWLLTDDRVQATLSARVDALLGLDPSFNASGDKRQHKKAVKHLEVGEDWWAAYPNAELRQMLIWGILLGVAPARHQGWPQVAGHGNRWLPTIKFWHPGSLRFDNPLQQWQSSDNAGNVHVITPGDGEWLLHMPFGAGRPWAYGAWRPLSLWVRLKQYAISDSGVAGERGATVVGTIDDGYDGDSKKIRQELASDLLAAANNRVVMLPKGFDLKLLEMSQATGQFYGKQIDMADDAIAILVRGGNLTTNLTEGSLAGSKTQKETGDDAKLRFDDKTIGETIHDQSLTRWAEYNYGDPSLAPWPAWPVEPEEDKSQRATTVKAVFEGVKLATDQGYGIDDEALIEEFDLGFIKPRTPGPLDKPIVPAPDPNADPNANPNADPNTGGEGGAAKQNTDPVPTEPSSKPKGAKTGVVQDVQATALNGAQGATMLEAMAKAANKELPRAGVVAAIETMFQLDADTAERIVDEAGNTFEPAKPDKPGNPFQPPADNGGSNARARNGARMAASSGGARASGETESTEAPRMLRPLGNNGEALDRLVVLGVPRAGKTTYADDLGKRAGIDVRHTDDLIAVMSWSEASAEVAKWLDEPGPYLIEGVCGSRALRKWMAANPEGKPCDGVLWLGQPQVELSPGQTTMLKGCNTIWSEVEPLLRARGVQIVNAAHQLGQHPIGDPSAPEQGEDDGE